MSTPDVPHLADHTDLADHTVVIAAASRHGCTRAIAHRVAAVLSAELSDRWIVQQSDLSDLRDLEGVDAVVLGSAVQLGHWMRPAVRALHQVNHDPRLALWLFSTGPVSIDADDTDRLTAADRSVESGCATEHVVFDGRLDATTLRWWERRVVAAAHTLGVDRRDWTAVDDWSRGIALQLSQATAETDRGR